MIYGGGFRKRSSGEKYKYENLDGGQGLYNKVGSLVSLIYSGDTIPFQHFSGRSLPREVFGKKIIVTDGYAFYNCTNLLKVSLPKAVNIKYGSFYGCVKLTEVFLPNVISIGQLAFASCSHLKKITCKQGMRSMVQEAIKESYLLQSIEIIEV